MPRTAIRQFNSPTKQQEESTKDLLGSSMFQNPTERVSLQSPTAQSEEETPSIISTQDGMDAVDENLNKLNDYSIPPRVDMPDTTGEKTSSDTLASSETDKKQEEDKQGYTAEELASVGIEDPASEGLIFDSATNQYYESPDTSKDSVVSEYESYKSDIEKATQGLNTQRDWALNQMRSMIASSDQDLANSISQIMNDYNIRKNELEEINKRALTAFKSSLTTGMTSRYLPTLSTTLLAAEERAGVQKLSELANETQGLILDAKQAAKTKKFDDLDTYITQIEEKREEQKNVVKDLYAKKKDFQDAQAEAQEIELAAQRDANIADLFIKGVTGAGDILLQLRKKGDKTTTIEDVQNAIESLLPPGLEDLVKTLRNNGAPQDVIQKVLSSTNMSEAYKNAGSYVSGGTGIIGEYNYYKAQAEALGQVPMDFSSYQNMDANRKAKIASASSVGNLPSSVATRIDVLSRSFDSAPIVKQYNEVLNKKQSVEAIVAAGVGGPGDLALVFEFMKALDPTSVVRESEYEAAAKSGNIFAGAYTRFNKGYFDPQGGILPEEVKKSFLNIIDKKFKVIDSQYQNLRDEKGRLIEMKTKDYDPNTPGTDYLVDYAGAAGLDSTTQQALQKGEEDKVVAEKIVGILESNPEKQELYDFIRESMPDATIEEIYQQLQ